MTTIDPTTPLGQTRLRIGDFGDVPFLPDSVITQELANANENVIQASQKCAGYILAMMAFKGHKKIGQLEVWGSDVFANYLQFLKLIVQNPNFSGVAPVPYVNVDPTTQNPLQQIATDWDAGYFPGAVVLPSWVDSDVDTPEVIIHEST